MNYKNFKSTLINQTANLSTDRLTLYSMYCTEKIINLYELIYYKFSFGDYLTVRAIGDFVWSNISLNGEQKKQTAYRWLEKLHVIVPDGNANPGLENALALNVCICLDVSLNLIIGTKKDAYISGLYIYDTLTQILFSKLTNEKYLDERVISLVDNTSIIKDELDDQLNILKTISTSYIDQELIESFRRLALRKKYSLENVNLDF